MKKHWPYTAICSEFEMILHKKYSFKYLTQCKNLWYFQFAASHKERDKINQLKSF